jgi:hypothetical protein
VAVVRLKSNGDKCGTVPAARGVLVLPGNMASPRPDWGSPAARGVLGTRAPGTPEAVPSARVLIAQLATAQLKTVDPLFPGYS